MVFLARKSVSVRIGQGAGFRESVSKGIFGAYSPMCRKQRRLWHMRPFWRTAAFSEGAAMMTPAWETEDRHFFP
jgi:hypothetical protein